MSESQETSDYPGSLDTWTTLTAKEDLAEVSDINKIKDAILNTQTELGVDPAGSLTDLVTRLDYIQDSDGAVAKGTSFPMSGLVVGQVFYRTDQNVLYIYNGSSWDSQGQSLSNVIYCASKNGELTDSTGGAYSSTTDPTTNSTFTGLYECWASSSTSYKTILRSKFKKIAGISTVTVYARLMTNSNNDGDIQVDIGGQTGTVDITSLDTWEWKNFTVDVSGLSDLTVYDITVSLKNDNADADNATFMDSIIMFGS